MKRLILIAVVVLLAAWAAASRVSCRTAPASRVEVAAGIDRDRGSSRPSAPAESGAGTLADAPTAALPTARTEAVQRQTTGDPALVVLVENDLGEPLAHADVKVMGVTPESLRGLTDSSGRARFELPADWSEARVRAVWREKRDGNDGPVLRGEALCEPPLTDAPIRVLLLRRGVVRGRVVAEDGTPAPSATVHVDDSRDATSTYANGAFELLDVLPGTRTLSAESYGIFIGTSVDVPPGGEVADVELRLPPGGWIEGRMLTTEGAAAVDRPVHVSPDDEDKREVRTGANGGFRIGPLAPSEYEVYGFLAGELKSDDIGVMMEALVATPARVNVDETTQVVLRPPTGPRPHLSGVVLRDGEPLRAAFVLVVREARSYLAGPRCGTADTEGRFDIVLSGPGRQLVLVYPKGAFDASMRCFVDVPAEGLRGVVLKHPTGAVVLEFEEASPRMTRAELDPLDAVISISQLSGARRLLASSEATPSFRHLAAGSYRLTVFSKLHVSGPNVLMVGDGVEVRVPVKFEEGGTLRVQLEEAASPLPDITLLVVNDEGRPLGRTDANHDSSEGPWSSPVLARGRWCVLGAASDGRVGTTPWTTVTPDAVAQVKMSFQEGARLTCMARRGDGPLPASFRLYDAENREVSSLFVPPHGIELVPMRSDEGHFGPLPPGRYRVVSRDAQGDSVERSVTLAAGENARVSIDYASGD